MQWATSNPEESGWNMEYPNSTMQISNIQVPFLRDSVSKPRESS